MMAYTNLNKNIMPHFDFIQKFFIWAIPVLFAITLHEVAHGWVAAQFGDKTAQRLGRLSLNPIRHIDPIGTVIVPCILFFVGGFIFGWAKPVPVDWRNLNNPKRDMALVALAGPFANILMALCWGMIAKIGFSISSDNTWIAMIFANMGVAGIIINLWLCILNLIPIPPLDGSRVVSSFLSTQAAETYNKLERFGLIILLLLLATGILSKILLPVTHSLFQSIMALFGIS